MPTNEDASGSESEPDPETQTPKSSAWEVTCGLIHGFGWSDRMPRLGTVARTLTRSARLSTCTAPSTRQCTVLGSKLSGIPFGKIIIGTTSRTRVAGFLPHHTKLLNRQRCRRPRRFRLNRTTEVIPFRHLQVFRARGNKSRFRL